MNRSLGDKRRRIPPEKAQDILQILNGHQDGDTRTVVKDGQEETATVSRIFPASHFGFRKITVERPLRLNFQASAERIARLEDQRAFQGLTRSRKRGNVALQEEAKGQELQEAIRNRDEFQTLLDAATKRAEFKLRAPVGNSARSCGTGRDGRRMLHQGGYSRAGSRAV